MNLSWKNWKNSTEIFLSGTKIDANPTTVFSHQTPAKNGVCVGIRVQSVCNQRGIGPGAPLRPTGALNRSEKPNSRESARYPQPDRFCRWVRACVMRITSSEILMELKISHLDGKSVLLHAMSIFPRRCCWDESLEKQKLIIQFAEIWHWALELG